MRRTRTRQEKNLLTYIHLASDQSQPPRLAHCTDSIAGVQEVLGGSYEPVPVDCLDHLVEEEGTFHLFIDGNGKAKDLPVNVLASRLGRLFPGDVVVGDAILVRNDRWADGVALSPVQWDLTLDHVSAVQVWSRVRSYAEMVGASIDFLEGRLVRSPDHCGPLDLESNEIRDDLVHLTRHGLLTLGSQPAWNEGGWQQRPYVHFYLPDLDLMHDLVELLGRTDLVCLAVSPGERLWQDIPVTLLDGVVCTWAGRLPCDDIHDRWEDALHPEAADVVRGLPIVEVVDPRWDGGRRMWDTLRCAIDELGISALV